MGMNQISISLPEDKPRAEIELPWRIYEIGDQLSSGISIMIIKEIY